MNTVSKNIKIVFVFLVKKSLCIHLQSDFFYKKATNFNITLSY